MRPRQRRRAISSSSEVFHPWTGVRSKTALALRVRVGWPCFDEPLAFRRCAVAVPPLLRISFLKLLPLRIDADLETGYASQGARIDPSRPNYAVVESAFAIPAAGAYTGYETARAAPSRFGHDHPLRRDSHGWAEKRASVGSQALSEQKAGFGRIWYESRRQLWNRDAATFRLIAIEGSRFSPWAGT